MPIMSTGLMPWFKRKVVDPVLQILQRGAEPKQLALSTALGFTLGLFPICGVTVFLCGIAIALLGPRCHPPSMMLANFVITPIELSLVIPFLRLGEDISGGPHFPLTSDALKKVLTGQASLEVLLSIAHALLGWFIAAPFIFAGLYLVLLPCFKYLVSKFGPPSSPRKQLNSHYEVRLKDCAKLKGYLGLIKVFVDHGGKSNCIWSSWGKPTWPGNPVQCRQPITRQLSWD